MSMPHSSQLTPFIHPDDMPDCYALLGVGSCMEPLIKNGELPTFDKTLEPTPGDIVSVIFTEEYGRKNALPGLIKRLVLAVPPVLGRPLVGNGMPVVLVEQINPPKTIAVPVCHVLAVHKFVGVARPAGPGRATIALPKREA